MEPATGGNGGDEGGGAETSRLPEMRVVLGSLGRVRLEPVSLRVPSAATVTPVAWWALA